MARSKHHPRGNHTRYQHGGIPQKAQGYTLAAPVPLPLHKQGIALPPFFAVAQGRMKPGECLKGIGLLKLLHELCIVQGIVEKCRGIGFIQPAQGKLNDTFVHFMPYTII